MALAPDDPGLRALRSADRAWSTAVVTSDADDRIRARLFGARRTSSPLRLAAAVLASFAAGALVASLALGRDAPAPIVHAPPATAVVETPRLGECNLEHDGRGARLEGECTLALSDLGVRIETARRTTLARELDRVRVFGGEARFEVAPRPSGAPPFEVRVGGGVIEVLGTTFVIRQEPSGAGEVELIAGRIRFVDHGGAITAIEAGGRHAWPKPPAGPEAPLERPAASAPKARAARIESRAVEIQPDPEPETPNEPERSVPSAARLERALERVARLRLAGDPEGAAAELQRVAGDDWDERTREVLSFELGRIVEVEIEDRARACAHWASHARSFPSGRYAVEVARALSRLGCENSGNSDRAEP
jgi:ferric-dicitrate binding protein FerR (iron transport regulator)